MVNKIQLKAVDEICLDWLFIVVALLLVVKLFVTLRYIRNKK